jgi:hypothetical protein
MEIPITNTTFTTSKIYLTQKRRILEKEKQIKGTIAQDGLESWTKTMEEILGFASQIVKLFDDAKEDPEARRMILKILGSNLELKDGLVRIKALNTFIFFKQIEKVQKGEIVRLEPQNSPIDGSKPPLSQNYSHLGHRSKTVTFFS